MKTLMTVVMLFVAGSAFAQENTLVKEMPVDANAIVVLQDLKGDVVVTNWNQPGMKIIVERQTSGTVYGIGEKPAPYDLMVYEAENQVFVSGLMTKGQIFGVSTYKELVKNTVYLPTDVYVDLLTEGADVTVKGIFRAVNVENINGTTNLDIQINYPMLLSDQ